MELSRELDDGGALPAPSAAVACPPLRERPSSSPLRHGLEAAGSPQCDDVSIGTRGGPGPAGTGASHRNGSDRPMDPTSPDSGIGSLSGTDGGGRSSSSPLGSLLKWTGLGSRVSARDGGDTEHLSLLSSKDLGSSSSGADGGRAEGVSSSVVISPTRRRHRDGLTNGWGGHTAVELQPLEREASGRADLGGSGMGGAAAVAERGDLKGEDSPWVDLGSLLLSPRSEMSVDDYQKGTLTSGVFNLSTTVIGAGIMGLPATFRVLGLPLGVVLLVAMAVLTQCSLEILVQTCTAMQLWTYSEVVGAACGPRARLVLDLSVLMNNLGMCIIYLIIVADVVSGTETMLADGSLAHPGMLFEWGLRDHWWASRTMIILGTMLFFLLPLACLKHVDSLSYTSAVAVASAVFFVGITMVLAVVACVEQRLQSPRMLPEAVGDGSWLSLFSVLPVMATAYTCHFSIHPIYHELKDRSEEKMFVITRVSLLLCTSIYLCTSLSGYLLFGSSTASDILINFDRDLGIRFEAAINTAIRCSYVLHIILVFPVIFYSLRGTIDSIFFPGAEFHVTEDNRRFFWITALGLIVVFLGAVAVPNIWTAFEITGATGTMLLSFFFPAVLALRDKLGAVSAHQICLAKFMIVFSIIVSVTGVTTSILNLIVGGEHV